MWSIGKEGFMEFDVVNVISQVGFPIAVAIYSLVVLNKTIQQNTEIMIKIATKLDLERDCKEKEVTK